MGARMEGPPSPAIILIVAATTTPRRSAGKQQAPCVASLPWRQKTLSVETSPHAWILECAYQSPRRPSGTFAGRNAGCLAAGVRDRRATISSSLPLEAEPASLIV